MLDQARVAVLGVGAMGSALVRGWIDSGVLRSEQVVVYDVATARAEEVATALGCASAAAARDAVDGAEVVLLAVKPQDALPAVRDAFAGVHGRRPLLLSICAGVPIATFERELGDVPVIRVMPNTPALVGEGASAFSRGRHADDDHAAAAAQLLGAVGVVHEVKESLLNAVTGLSGSGPAYVYVAIEALADGGVRNGLPRDVALSLAAQTLLGAARMVLETGEHPGALKDRVTSPGGTTIAGLASLEEHAFRGALIEAVTAATRRAGELG